MVSKENTDKIAFELINNEEEKENFNINQEEITETNKSESEDEFKYISNKIREDGKDLILLSNESKRNLFDRVFGKIGPGSMRGSIFNLTILCLGSGCLSIPKTVSEMSMVMTIVSIILTSSLTYWTLCLLGITCEKLQIYNYSKVVRKLFGKSVGIVLDMSIFIYTIGIFILYQVISKINFKLIIAYKLLGEIVYNFGRFFEVYNDIESFLTTSFWSWTWVKLCTMYGMTTFVILPLCLLKDVSRLRMGSLLGVITLIFLILLIIVQCPSYIRYYWNNVYKEDDPTTHLNIFNISSSFDKNLFFFQGIATLFYTFTSHLGAFPVFQSLSNNVKRRVNKVILRTILLDVFLFIIIAIFGYLTWPVKTPALIIERDNIAGGVDVIMSLGRIGLIVIIIMKLPVSYNSFRLSFFEMVFGDSEITNKRY